MGFLLPVFKINRKLLINKDIQIVYLLEYILNRYILTLTTKKTTRT